MYLFIQSSNQEIYIEHLLCAKLYMKNINKSSLNLATKEIIIWGTGEIRLVCNLLKCTEKKKLNKKY